MIGKSLILSTFMTVQCYGALTEWGTFQAVYVEETGLYHVLCLDETYDIGMLVTSAGFSSRVEFDHGVRKITFGNLTSSGVPQTWVVASAGERISAQALNAVEDSQCLLRTEEDVFVVETAGPSTVEIDMNADMYLAFVCRDDPYYTGSFYYGWLRFNGDTVLGFNYDIGDGEMVVGGGAWTGGIPEPSGGMLMLLGLASLGLKRRHNNACMG